MTFLTDQTNPSYRASVHSLLDTKKKIKIAVAFLGADSANLMAAVQSKAQVLCNLESGATNPSAIRTVMGQHEVKTLKNLHAKVLWSPSVAIVGSANLSANGLNYEDRELFGWREAGIKVNQLDQLQVIERWFDLLWKVAAPISEKMLKDAEELWKKGRTGRPPQGRSANDSLVGRLVADPDYFKDRAAYLTMIVGADPSPEIQAADETDSKSSGLKIESFEGWKKLPENSELISFYFDPKSGAKAERDGLWISLSHTRIRSKWRIACREVESVCGYKMSAKDEKFLASKIPEIWLNATGDSEGRYIDLFRVAELLSKKT